MKSLVFGLFAFLLSLPAFSAEEPKFGLGVDFALPFILGQNGSSVNERGNFNIGVDGRYRFTENINAGMRVNFDVEGRGGSTQQVGITPGAQYLWMPKERWNPFARFDVPVLLRGNQDIGIAGGGGVYWNLGGAIGVPNMVVRYDFELNYYFGIGSAPDAFTLDIFKIGFDYRF